MKKTSLSLPLQSAFDSVFHHKLDFKDFLNLTVEDEFKCFEIHDRRILNPSKKLKKYLQFLNGFVFEHADINTRVVYSYRRGVSALSAVKKHTSKKYYFQTDMQDFFNSITTKDVESILNENLSAAPISDISLYKEQLLNLITVNNVLPIGFSTSPSISNSCLFGFDNDLEKYCIDNDVLYTRYSDDIILSSNKKERLNNIQEVISKILETHFDSRIRVNNNKTKYTHKGNKVKLLGMVVLPNGKITVDKSVKNSLEVLLHFYVSDKKKFVDYFSKNFDGNESKISGQINYINSIDSEYITKLRMKYGNFVIDSFKNNTAK